MFLFPPPVLNRVPDIKRLGDQILLRGSETPVYLILKSSKTIDRKQWTIDTLELVQYIRRI